MSIQSRTVLNNHFCVLFGRVEKNDVQGCIQIKLKTIIKKIIETMEEIYRSNSPHQHHSLNKENNSIATLDSPSNFRIASVSLKTSVIHQIFQTEPQNKLLSSKITKKAVSWLMRVAWQKNCSFQSIWTALTLFYGYRRRKVVNKQQLECLLLMCLQLSTKFHESTPLKTTQLLCNCSEAISKELFVKYELELLELFNFQIYVSHAFQTLSNCEALSEEQTWKVLFLAELYLTQEESILFNWQKCQRLIQIIRNELDSCELECLQIRELIKDPCNTIILKKYGCKFDIEMFTIIFQ